MVFAAGIWAHLQPGEFRMIHGTNCCHATEKAAHLAHYKPNLPAHGSPVVGTKGRDSK